MSGHDLFASPRSQTRTASDSAVENPHAKIVSGRGAGRNAQNAPLANAEKMLTISAVLMPPQELWNCRAIMLRLHRISDRMALSPRRRSSARLRLGGSSYSRPRRSEQPCRQTQHSEAALLRSGHKRSSSQRFDSPGRTFSPPAPSRYFPFHVKQQVEAHPWAIRSPPAIPRRISASQRHISAP